MGIVPRFRVIDSDLDFMGGLFTKSAIPSVAAAAIAL